MKKILIIGAGAMGSAFAVPCIENKNDVTIVGTHLEDNLIKDIGEKCLECQSQFFLLFHMLQSKPLKKVKGKSGIV